MKFTFDAKCVKWDHHGSEEWVKYFSSFPAFALFLKLDVEVNMNVQFV